MYVLNAYTPYLYCVRSAPTVENQLVWIYIK